MGFELFPSAPPAGHLAAPDHPRGSPQARHSHPTEPFPRTQPHCVSAAVASSPLSWCLVPSRFPPKCSSFQLPARELASCTRVATSALGSLTQSSTSRLCSMSESVAAHRVATMPSPMLSWALLPFRALPSTAVSVLWTPRQAPVSSTASCAFLENRADLVPKHPARRGLVRTDLSWTFLLRFTDADGILRIVGPSSRDLPAVEVAFSPLVLHTASPKLGLAISPSSRSSSAEAPSQDLTGERGTCCTQSASSPKCARRPARPPKCSSPSAADCILHHRAGTRWFWRTAFAELPTLLGFVTSKIVLSSPPKRLTQVHEQSVPAPEIGRAHV